MSDNESIAGQSHHEMALPIRSAAGVQSSVLINDVNFSQGWSARFQLVSEGTSVPSLGTVSWNLRSPDGRVHFTHTNGDTFSMQVPLSLAEKVTRALSSSVHRKQAISSQDTVEDVLLGEMLHRKEWMSKKVDGWGTSYHWETPTSPPAISTLFSRHLPWGSGERYTCEITPSESLRAISTHVERVLKSNTVIQTPEGEDMFPATLSVRVTWPGDLERVTDRYHADLERLFPLQYDVPPMDGEEDH